MRRIQIAPLLISILMIPTSAAGARQGRAEPQVTNGRDAVTGLATQTFVPARRSVVQRILGRGKRTFDTVQLHPTYAVGTIADRSWLLDRTSGRVLDETKGTFRVLGGSDLVYGGVKATDPRTG